MTKLAKIQLFLVASLIFFGVASSASAATQIFRSVGPSNTSTLATDNSHANTITVSTGTATFSTALPNNVGVGDVVLVDTNDSNTITSADTLLFIHGRTDSTHYTLRTETGAVPSDIAVNDTYQLYRAYTSLANAEIGTINPTLSALGFSYTGGNRDLVTSDEEWNITCYANGTTADTTAVTIDGWTTDSDNFINIYTPFEEDEVGVSQRHEGVWDETYYHFEPSFSSNDQTALVVQDNFVRVDGLQMGTVTFGTLTGYIVVVYVNPSNESGSSDVMLSNNIVRNVISSGSVAYNDGIYVDGYWTVKIWNNIVYDFVATSNGPGIVSADGGPTMYVYNNTVVNADDCIAQIHGTVYAKNNIVQDCNNGFSGSFASSSDFNISDLSDAPNNTFSGGQATISFLDDANDNYHLNQVDTVAINQGEDLSADSGLAFTTDIDEDIRADGDIGEGGTGLDWDIGADEYRFVPDATSPILSEVTPVSNPNYDDTPNYTFNSNEAGTISYGGDCSSDTTTATNGNNTITFNTLPEGTYSNCTITVTDGFSNVSDPLAVTSFSVRALNQIFRSVGPSNTSALATDNSHANTVTLSSGTATFSTSLPDNVGVGDAVLIDSSNDNAITSADTLLFIQARTDSTHYTLQTQTGAVPSDISSNDTYAIYRAYTSLANAEAGTENTSIPISFTGGNRDLVTNEEQWNIACYANGTTADTTTVTIDGWTTGESTHIKIYTPTNSSEVGVTQRHSGVWDEEKYRLEVSGGGLGTFEDHTVVEGLQVKITAQIDYEFGIGTDAVGAVIKNNIVTSDFSFRAAYGINAYAPVGASSYVFNNIVYGFNGHAVSTMGIIVGGASAESTTYLYNNTVADNGIGIYSNRTTIAINNISQDNISEDYYGLDPFDVSSSNNISSDDTAPGSNSKINTSVSFVDETNKNFHLASDDTSAKEAGADLSADEYLPFDTDVDGGTRPVGNVWDIGADEFAPVEFVSVIDPGNGSGTDYTSLFAWEASVQTNLTVVTTKVFSHTGITGTILDTDSVTGATSGATADVVHVTATQILLENIVGTFQSGEQIYETQNTNYVTISNIGDSAVAVASCRTTNGTADVTGVEIDGWTTNTINYIKIWTDPNDQYGRHSGKWDETKYSLQSSGDGIVIAEKNVRIEGLQIGLNVTGTYQSAILMPSFADDQVVEHWISHNIIRLLSGTYGVASGIEINDGFAYDGERYIFNNIIYGFLEEFSSGIKTSQTIWVIEHIYNNTVYGNLMGINVSAINSDRIICKNNISYNNTDYNYYNDVGWDTRSNYNLSGPTYTDAPGSNAVNGATVSFVSTVSSNEDLHLQMGDVGAKDGGADLSTDVDFPFDTDIDGDTRPVGTAWDIGADEFVDAMQIFRSVGPSNTSTLATDSSHARTVTLASGVATFSVALADNIGVGDAVLIDTGGTDQAIDASDTLLFIHARTDSTHYTLRTENGAVPSDIAINDTYQIYRAYTSLSNAEAGTKNNPIPIAFTGGNRDLVTNNEQWNIACYGDANDGSYVAIDGWNTSENNYLKIYTPYLPGEVGTRQRHTGVWNTNYFYSQRTNSIFYISDAYVRIEGLQLAVGNVDSRSAILTDDVNEDYGEYYFTHNVIKNFENSTGAGININSDPFVRQDVYVSNNIIYDFFVGRGLVNFEDNAYVYFYNNTLYNNDIGLEGGQGYLYAINNIFQENNDGLYCSHCYSPSDYNISDIAGDAPGTNSQNGVSVNFVDAYNDNFHLHPTDTVAIDAGTFTVSSIVTHDIDGQLRTTWDIGADEASIDFDPTVMQTGGDYSTLSSWESNMQTDLTADTTRVFSHGGITGTILDTDSVTGATSGATADVVHATDNGAGQQEILLENISGTFESGEQVYVTQNVNYVTISNNGNPANAVAKIDGVWSGADTTAVDITGWETGVNNHVRIYTTETARHQGKWDEGKYRLEVSDYLGSHRGGINVYIKNIIIDGLQISRNINQYSGNFGISLVPQEDVDIDIRNNIIRSVDETEYYNYGISYNDYGVNFDAKIKISNNIIYDFSNPANNNVCIKIGYYGNFYVYNNSLINCNTGIDNNPNLVVINSITQNCNRGFTDTYGSWGLGTSNNISSDGTAPGTNSKTNTTVEFVDATNDDFRLAETDTEARDAGTDLSADANLAFSTDIQDTARGGAWDIGADEVPVDFVSSVMQSSGDYATLASWEDAVESDLTLDTTRIFSGSLTGTLAENATVTLYRSAVSTGITATVVAKSTVNGQILVDNITNSTTPLVAQANDQWYLDASNYFTITGTGDALGASPRAVAKIDGAWTVADAIVGIGDWVVDIDNSIEIYTTETARHNGKWSDDKYRIHTGGWQSGIVVAEEYVKVDGVQISNTTTGDNYPSNIMLAVNTLDSSIDISNSIFKADWSGLSGNPYAGSAILQGGYGAVFVSHIHNNIFYGFNSPYTSFVIDARGGTYYFYNNTVDDCDVLASYQYIGAVIAKNNLISNTPDPFFGFDSSSDYNATDFAETPVGAHDKVSQTISFVSTTAGSEDFHLLESDTAAKNAGADLSTDPYLNVTTDIDGSSRDASINAFDIGADETATKIFRSVGPSNTSTLATDSSHARTVTLASGVATFSVALANNIGVGDAVLIDTGGTDQTIDASDTLLFIHARTDSTHYTLRTENGAVPSDIAVNDTYQIYRAYTSLSNAEAGTKNTSIPISFTGGDRDLVTNNEQWNIACYGDAVDTTAVEINGWETGVQNYLKVYTPVEASEVGVTQRHSGVWDDGKYNLSVTSGGSLTMRVYSPHTNLIGLQINNYYNGVIYLEGGATDTLIDSCIVRNTADLAHSGGYNLAIYEKDAIVRNSIFIQEQDIINVRIRDYAKIYNCNSYGGSYGFAYQTGTTPDVINSMATGATLGSFSGTFSAFSDYNLSDDATAPGANSKINTTVSFVNEASNNFHLSPDDTTALDQGTDLSSTFTTDIDGHLRTQWDIGADEASIDFDPTVMQTGGDYSSLAAWEAGVQTDLVADTTRVFSNSGITGTILDTDSVTGATSGATADVVHATDNGAGQQEILLENISGTFESGEQIQVDGSNYVTISNNGNPANAVAKIDGAWSVADGTAVDVNGWTTGPNNHIRIYTTETARHQGKWDEGRYRIVADAFQVVSNREWFVHIDGLQIYNERLSSDSSVLGLNNFETNVYSENFVSNNILRGNNPDTSSHSGINIYSTQVGSKVFIWNNIVYDIGSNSSNVIGISNAGNGYGYVYNNTLYNMNTCFLQSDDSTFGYVFTNNIAQNCSRGFIKSWSWNAECDYNISSDATAPGANSKTDTAVTFVDAENDDFHLSIDDTSVIDAGADFSADESFSFSTDIDGEDRLTGSWDIGADEAPARIYRSVGPSNTSALDDDNLGTETLSISASTATFSSAIADNVGVGDAIVYDSDGDNDIDGDDSIVFIHGRTDSTHYTVKSADGSWPANVVTDEADWEIYRAYTSLANAEAGTINSTLSTLGFSFTGGNRDLVTNNEQWNIACYGDAADTTAVEINGWETGENNYIKVYTPYLQSEVGISQRHSGIAGTGYVLQLNNENRIYEDYVRIDGIEFYNTLANDVAFLFPLSGGVNSDIQISNCLLHGFTNVFYMQGYLAKYKLWNNILYDNTGYGFFADTSAPSVASYFYIYNNTVFGGTRGINVYGGTRYFYNNIVQNTSENNYNVGTPTGSSNNISEDATSPDGVSYQNKTVQFMDKTNHDFHLSGFDEAALGQGTDLSADSNLSFSTDIDGEPRARWDIGADESLNDSYKMKGDLQLRGNVKFK